MATTCASGRVGTHGNHESSLTGPGCVTVGAMEFVSSWCEVRWRIVRDVEAGFVELADDDLRVRAEALLGDNNDQAARGNTA
ncbi:hypothetical protein GCM10010347_57460 [Streptomyces cirratus]|uniref:Uncharacterized protein n=2 Tax=Streptomyces cirratus TaxID=68187 RepID=A0ABQ3F0J1_9ACTN|nr:hypothetical protein GCM10010347_57460 [Streptomyces cirratus]